MKNEDLAKTIFFSKRNPFKLENIHPDIQHHSGKSLDQDSSRINNLSISDSIFHIRLPKSKNATFYFYLRLFAGPKINLNTLYFHNFQMIYRITI